MAEGATQEKKKKRKGKKREGKRIDGTVLNFKE